MSRPPIRPILTNPAPSQVRPLAERLRHYDGHGKLGSAGPAQIRPLFATSDLPGSPDPERERADLLEQARAEAELEGLRAAQTKVEAVVERYMDSLRRLQQVVREAGRPLASEVVDLALVVARELIGREVCTDRQLVLTAVDLALKSVTTDARVVVRMGPADLTYARRRRPDLEEAGVVFVEDASLGVGGCVVESATQVIDASIEARLDAVRETLVALVSETQHSGLDDEESQRAGEDGC